MAMMKRMIFSTAALCVAILISGCSPDDIYPTFPIGADVKRWVSFLAVRNANDTLHYSNKGLMTVKGTLLSSNLTVADCVIDEIVEQCQYETFVMSFTSEANSYEYYISLFLFPRNRLVASHGKTSSLTPEIFRFESVEDTLTIYPDIFKTQFIEDYNFKGQEFEAISVSVLDTLSLISPLPPASFILVKDFGIAEWSDYDGNVFVAEE